MHECCPTLSTQSALIAAAKCLQPAKSSCAHNSTSWAAVTALGLECLSSASLRGFFLVSRDQHGNTVCTAGDTYRVWITSADESAAHPTRFSTYAQSIASGLYFANITGGTLLPGRRTYVIRTSLLETQHRALQKAEGFGELKPDGASPTRDWFRYRLCVGHQIDFRIAVHLKEGSKHGSRRNGIPH